MAKHAFGEGTMTFVFTDSKKTKVVGKKFKIHCNSDIREHFPLPRVMLSDGDKLAPLVGDNLWRELTYAELERLGLPASFKETNYMDCLVKPGMALLDIQ